MQNEMTIEAAIIELNRLKVNGYMPVDVDRRDRAIEKAKTALSKQIPKKPINPTYGNIKCECPNCFSSVFYATDLFCRKCGQALDWSDEE